MIKPPPLELSTHWQEQVRNYTSTRGLGNDYQIVNWYPLGGGYLIVHPGFYNLRVFSLFGRFSLGRRRKHHTLFCIEITTPHGEQEELHHTYLFHLLARSVFSSIFDLRKIYHYVRDKRYATILGGVVTDEQWSVIKAHYDYTCLACGKQEPEIILTLDHVIPRSKEGTSILSNIQPLCRSCNSAKGDTAKDYRPSYFTSRMEAM